jgi:hypothetical protein
MKKESWNFKDLSNQKIGRLTVISKSTKKHKSHSVLWICECECSNIVEITSSQLKRTKSCGCLKKDTHWKGYEEISGYFFGRCKKSAKKRNLPFSITIEEIYDIYIQQNKKCAISGMDIFFCNSSLSQPKNYHRVQTASLDRIDSSKGYTKDNCQLLHKKINLMKSNYSDEEFINLCKIITEYNK